MWKEGGQAAKKVGAFFKNAFRKFEDRMVGEERGPDGHEVNVSQRVQN